MFRDMAEDHADWIHDVLGGMDADAQKTLIEKLDELRAIINEAELNGGSNMQRSA